MSSQIPEKRHAAPGRLPSDIDGDVPVTPCHCPQCKAILSDADKEGGCCPECDHDWQFEDHSFDHEYGTEQIHVDRCSFCDAERAHEPEHFDDDVI